MNLTALGPVIALLMYALIKGFVDWLRARSHRSRRPQSSPVDITPKTFRERLLSWRDRTSTGKVRR